VLKHHGSHEPCDGRVVGEEADHVGSPLDRRVSFSASSMRAASFGILRPNWRRHEDQPTLPGRIQDRGGEVDHRTRPPVAEVSALSQARLNADARQRNERPRKALGYQTPAATLAQSVEPHRVLWRPVNSSQPAATVIWLASCLE
jgi:hypothetical protein